MKSSTQPLLTEKQSCEMCGKEIQTKPRAGKTRLYCSSACKQAAYRKKRRAKVEPRDRGRSVGNGQRSRGEVPICAIKGCDNEVQPGKRGLWRMYCSDKCKERAKRIARAERKRRIPSFGPKPEQPQTLPTDELFYWRKPRGVVHMGVNRNVTFCGRDTQGMDTVSNVKGSQFCQRCQSTRDNQTWWMGYRAAFGDG